MGETPLLAAGRRVARYLPAGVLGALKPLYFRYRSRAADRRFDPPDRTVERAPGAPDHVLVVCIDALRPDAVPDLGLEFGTAVAPAPWTVPSVTSLHTGRYPHEHGAVARTTPDEPGAGIPEQADAATLPAVLAAAGYRSYHAAAFLTPFLAVRGWYRRHRVFDHCRAGRVVDGYRAFRERHGATYAYLHLGDLHAPLDPPAAYADRRGVDRSVRGLDDLDRFTDTYDGSRECRRFRTERLRLYRAALDHVEDVLGPLVADVRDDTLVVVCGDHGEAHWEHHAVDRRLSDARPNHGVGHGGTPLDAVARVPVAVAAPDGTEFPAIAGEGSPSGGVDAGPAPTAGGGPSPADPGTTSLPTNPGPTPPPADPAPLPPGGWPSLVDVPRTVAGQVLAADPFPGGRDWAEPVPADRVAICEGVRYPPERKAAYRGRYKVVRSVADDETLAAAVGPGGEDFDAQVPPDVREALVAALPPFGDADGETAAVDRVARERLAELGYV